VPGALIGGAVAGLVMGGNVYSDGRPDRKIPGLP